MRTPEQALAECMQKLKKLETKHTEQALTITRYQQWVSDIQSGMFVNCVYCGHRYGPKDGGATLKDSNETMQEALKRHVESCPEHPMAALKKENALLRARLGVEN